MKARIHHGAHEIGGNCIEVEASGKRIVLDVGRPLDAAEGVEVRFPDVPGLRGGGDGSLLGLIISHPHQDHYGLVGDVAPEVPVYLGEAAQRLLQEASFFTRAGVTLRAAGFLRHRQPFLVGPFTITPYLNDHSAFDAYSLLVEGDGRRLFYTGDIRARGRKAGLFEELLRKPPAGVHVLLMEGTHVRPAPERAEAAFTEDDVERQCIETFRATPGMVLAIYSGQNIDRLVTMFRAAKQAERDLVVDLYTATMARATGNPNIPQPGWDRLRVYVPEAQRRKVKREREFERVNWVRDCRIFPEDLAPSRKRLVMTFRESMASELDAAGCLDGAHAVWSLWKGYLSRPESERLRAFLAVKRIPLAVHHASGHATVADLQRLVTALAPGRVVPIHSSATERFSEFFPRVERRGDGEWWDV